LGSAWFGYQSSSQNWSQAGGRIDEYPAQASVGANQSFAEYRYKPEQEHSRGTSGSVPTQRAWSPHTADGEEKADKRQ